MPGGVCTYVCMRREIHGRERKKWCVRGSDVSQARHARRRQAKYRVIRTKVVRHCGAVLQSSGWQYMGAGTACFWGRMSSSVVFPAATKACTSLSACVSVVEIHWVGQQQTNQPIID